MVPRQLRVHAFRSDYPEIVNEIRLDVAVFPAIEISGQMEGVSYVGLWDTGATGTCITKKVVDDLGLKPIGKSQCSHAGGQGIRNRYLINLVLPNNMGVRDVSAVEVDIDGGIDVLIGMDIITRGDFVLTHAKGKTHFSFRMPALGGIDVSIPPMRSSMSPPPFKRLPPSRNGRCPCGSGKKYKACCTPRFS